MTCVYVCYSTIACVFQLNNLMKILPYTKQSYLRLNGPLGNHTQHAARHVVITLHDSSNEASLLICRFQGQGDARARVCVFVAVRMCLAASVDPA